MKRKQHISPRAKRANLKWQVNAVTPKGPLDGVTKNISTRGAYVCCARPLRLNEVFHMSINSPEKSLHVKAEVVWSNKYGPDDEINPRGMGVRFLKISSQDRKFIAKEVNQNFSDNLGLEKLETITIEAGDD
ncbi:MAG: PilZ domain-containing protein [Deltaproteobacteria bacterium]|nr:PilZ domain-containing protein [Deltaproteobacteria bacterium]